MPPPSTTALCCICIVLPLHCLCKTGPLFILASPLALFMSPFRSLQPLTIINIIITVSSVGVVPVCRDLAVSCSTYRTGQDMAQVCEGRGLQCSSIAGNKQQTQERLRQEKRGENKKDKVWVGVHQRKEIPGRRIPAQRFLPDTSLLLPPFFCVIFPSLPSFPYSRWCVSLLRAWIGASALICAFGTRNEERGLSLLLTQCTATKPTPPF